MEFDRELLDILVCPRCRQRLRLESGGDRLACDGCRVDYPIVDGIADLLPESARSMDA
ncbi:MAG: Trm112 family protein [Candidatus Krumholzibacteriia bacterium]|nr:Trm112 family protein [bacterium]MCB9514937.1 Trm112 family protein [Candidatus Latescibacterota bacterium]